MRRLLMLSPLLLLLLLLPRGGTTCYVTDGGAHYYLFTYGETAEEVLGGLGIRLSPEDRVTEQVSGGARRICVERRQTVTVVTPAEQRTVTTYGQTVGALLGELGLYPDRGLRLTCDPGRQTFDGMEIRLVRMQCYETQTRQLLPFQTVYLESPSLEEGETFELCSGRAGQLCVTERVFLQNGIQVGRTALAVSTLVTPRSRIVLCGVDRTVRVRESNVPEGGVIEAGTGELLRYSRALRCEATAYSCDGAQGITATGTIARVGAIAVDPRFIPYGTQVYIVTDDGAYVYGPATAEDTGAFTGNRIDLYFDTTAECWEFGRRMCTVYILD